VSSVAADRGRRSREQALKSVSAALFAAAVVVGGLAGVSLFAKFGLRAANVGIDLFGTGAGGWSTSPGMETNPGPTLVVNLGDRVTMQLTSEDAPMEHTFWIDYNRNNVPDFGEPNSPIFAPVPITYVFDALQAGTFPYYCGVHSIPGSSTSPMRGTWITAAGPSATIASPAGGTSWTGRVAHDIVFNLMADGPPSALTVWVNYSYGGGAIRGSVAGPIPGAPNPNVVSWTPLFDAPDVVINVTVRDGRGVFGYRESATFEVDSTAPTLTSTVPTSGATGVALNAKVLVTWSEGMNRSATGSPASFGVTRVADGHWLSGAIEWSADSRQMTFTPSPAFDTFTTYRILVNGSAKDDSQPGNPVGGTFVSEFTTGAAPDTIPPEVSSVAAVPPSQREEGFVNLTADVADETSLGAVSVHVVGPSLDVNLTMVRAGGTTWFVNRSYAQKGAYMFTAWALDGATNAGSQSGSFVIVDLAAPVAPLSLSATVRLDGGVVVSWGAVDAPDLLGYRVHRGQAAGGPYASLTPTPISSSAPREFVDTSVVPGATYVYVVTAVDVDGNESPSSAEAAVTVPALRPDLLLAILLVLPVVGAAAVLIGLLWWRRRRRPAKVSDETHK